MATSADRDDRDEKDEAAEDEASAEEKAEKAEKAAALKASAKPANDEADDDRDEDEEDDEDEKPAPKAASKAAAKPAKARRTGSRGPGAGRAKIAPAQVQGGGSLGKSVLLFFVIVIGLGVGFMVLGREQPQEVAKPKWSVGQTVDVEITLVKNDRQDLACASADEIAGKHCAFEAINKPWSKGDANDDKKMLKPYTTVEHVQFTAAGLWSEPALAPDKLPATRFSVKCKYKVEGNVKNMAVRWEQTGQWYPNNEWYAGTVSECRLAT